jgi:hypothetical protein
MATLIEFIVTGRLDSDYVTNTDTCKSVSGSAIFLEGAPVVMQSNGQKSVTLSMTEAELAAAVQTAQDMMFAMRVIESIGLWVQKPMILKLDNSGAHGLTHNWSVGGHTRHMDATMRYLGELKEDGIIACNCVSGEENSADLFTKNLPGQLFNKHTSTFVGQDNYMTPKWDFEDNAEANIQPKKPTWQLKKTGKTKARILNINYGDNNFKGAVPKVPTWEGVSGY